MKMPNRACTKCGSALSQYNSGSLCAPCSRSDAAPNVPDRAWRDPLVQRALAEWDFGTLLRLLRRRSGLSQMQMRALTGFTQSHISGLENGRKQLGGRDAIIDLLTGLGVPADLRPLLLTPLAGRPQTVVTEALDPAMPWTADRMVTSLEVAVGGPVKRRSVLAALSGSVLTQYILQSAVAPTEALAAETGDGTRVTVPLLESLQSTTNALREMDAASGSGSLAGTAKQQLRVLLGLMKTGTYNDRTGRRLAAVTADTAMQAGWYALDGGNHDAAQRLLLGALRAAHASGDSRLRAGALSFLAIHGYSVGDPRDAVTAARTARQAISDKDAPALHAMLLTRQARGHARLREERHALAALQEAEALCARGAGEDDPHWLYWINPGEILGQRGSAYLEMGKLAEAASTFAQARGVLSQEEVRTRAQFLSRAATAQMRAGDADAGCAIGEEVLMLVNGVHSARLNEHLHSMLHEARQSGDTVATRSFVEHGEGLLRERASA
ncbi:helix-turn-helix domain-containing protein [Streptomyces sp. NRRL F-5126]|uniref:helix-turn-helix domain-containing protein n=1 Tax=Streptomyces sp. NRRL F-5126 TaxID=1463857 RepID=UPI0004C63A7F|nr:helix-turn-helix transcriptional regulator [Streptomyces sp. NRRL F-5126]